MQKRTLYFGNAAYLSTQHQQLCISLHPQAPLHTIPIEDIAILVLDSPQIKLTHALLAQLLEANVAIISCNDAHLPIGLFMPLQANYKQHHTTNAQLNASEPLKKQLWQQTITQKIKNQYQTLHTHNLPTGALKSLYQNVNSGDTDNKEAQAAVHYWKNIFLHTKCLQNQPFARERYGAPPNHLLNYAYTLLRATTARALVSAGLLPVAGIHHHNQYNAYPLADDIMEPYRAYADRAVLHLLQDLPHHAPCPELNTETKQLLLQMLQTDVHINSQTKPLMQALSTTAASLAKCYMQESKKISYPNFQ